MWKMLEKLGKDKFSIFYDIDGKKLLSVEFIMKKIIAYSFLVFLIVTIKFSSLIDNDFDVLIHMIHFFEHFIHRIEFKNHGPQGPVGTVE